MTEATPRPWDWDQGDIGQDYARPYCTIFTPDDEIIIAEVNDCIDKEIGAANARLIVRAVNAHDALVKALEATTIILSTAMHAPCPNREWMGAIAKTSAALALAREDEP